MPHGAERRLVGSPGGTTVDAHKSGRNCPFQVQRLMCPWHWSRLGLKLFAAWTLLASHAAATSLMEGRVPNDWENMCVRYFRSRTSGSPTSVARSLDAPRWLLHITGLARARSRADFSP